MIIKTMEYKDRIKEARKKAKLTQAKLAELIDVDQTSISDLERGKSKSSSYNAAIAHYCGVDAYWLETGRGEMVSSKHVRKAAGFYGNTEPGPDIKGYCPVISWVQAGNWCEAVDIYYPGTSDEWVPCPVGHSENTFVLRVSGLSMHNPNGDRSFKPGDLIFVDPNRDPANGNLVVIKMIDSQEATFKQLIIEGEKRYLRALNPAWPEPIIKINGEAHICGVVICKVESMV